MWGLKCLSVPALRPAGWFPFRCARGRLFVYHRQPGEGFGLHALLLWCGALTRERERGWLRRLEQAELLAMPRALRLGLGPDAPVPSKAFLRCLGALGAEAARGCRLGAARRSPTRLGVLGAANGDVFLRFYEGLDRARGLLGGGRVRQGPPQGPGRGLLPDPRRRGGGALAEPAGDGVGRVPAGRVLRGRRREGPGRRWAGWEVRGGCAGGGLSQLQPLRSLALDHRRERLRGRGGGVHQDDFLRLWPTARCAPV